VRLAPLVSIDLNIRDNEQNIFVALRTNEPAKVAYLVPGGCIRNGETIENAFVRILEKGNRLSCPLCGCAVSSPFQTFYPANRYGQSGYGTPYVVLACEVRFSLAVR
jgi:colanic acid biosynthesis protein WcaH